MSWSDLISAIAAATDADTAQRIEASIRTQLAGNRVAIPKRRTLTAEQIQNAMRSAQYDAKQAARSLGCSTATVYRKLRVTR